MDTPDADSPPKTDTVSDPDSGDDSPRDVDSGAETSDTDAGSGDGAGDTDTGEDPSEEVPEPTPQSAALRRQQLYVGYGGALVAGAALGVGTFQQFTDSPVLAVLVALAGAALVMLLVQKSIFPGGSAAE